jgi:hypothetical protein
MTQQRQSFGESYLLSNIDNKYTNVKNKPLDSASAMEVLIDKINAYKEKKYSRTIFTIKNVNFAGDIKVAFLKKLCKINNDLHMLVFDTCVFDHTFFANMILGCSSNAGSVDEIRFLGCWFPPMADLRGFISKFTNVVSLCVDAITDTNNNNNNWLTDNVLIPFLCTTALHHHVENLAVRGPISVKLLGGLDKTQRSPIKTLALAGCEFVDDWAGQAFIMFLESPACSVRSLDICNVRMHFTCYLNILAHFRSNQEFELFFPADRLFYQGIYTVFVGLVRARLIKMSCLSIVGIQCLPDNIRASIMSVVNDNCQYVKYEYAGDNDNMLILNEYE